MLLSIVILNYKKVELTLRCIESLCKQFKKEFSENVIELVIVDNASEDDSVQVLKSEIFNKKYKSIKLIENHENVGFSRGCNIGAKNAKGEVFLFLNNDTIVRDRGILDMAKYLSEHSETAILGGKLSNSDGSPQPSVGKFYTPLNTLFLLLGLQRAGLVNKNPTKISEVDWVKGGCMMVKNSLFKQLGGFDENIFMYTEDMEFCYRAKIAGFRSFFYPDISVEHDEQGSSNRSFAIVNIYKNLLYFYKKHKSGSEYIFLKFLLRAKALSLIFIGKLSKNSYLTQTYEKALKVA